MVSLNLATDTFVLMVRELKLYKEIKSTSLIEDILLVLENSKGTATANITQGMAKLIDSLLRLNILDINSLTTKLSFLLKFNADVHKNLVDIMNEEVTNNYDILITSHKKDIEYNYKKINLVNIIKTFYDKIKNIKEEDSLKLLNDFREKLNDYDFSKQKVKGVISEIDLSDEDSFSQITSKIENNNKASTRMRCGWNELNEMLGGGFRKGETVLLSALQHNFKSGTLRSLFCQLVQYNKPTLINKNKKPLALFISFEDDADIICDFIYKYLKYSLEHEAVKEYDVKGMRNYIESKLQANGFNIKIIRAKADAWTYQSIIDKVNEYERDGYETQILITDYLSKLPLTGVNNTGPAGTGVRDMLTRMRDFCCEKEILYINAHQLSTEAKQLLRNGIPPEELVQEIANKGYYEGCKQLDQVVDLELHQHIARFGKENYKLTVQRGKRRLAEHLDESKRYFTLQFPNDVMCIPPNVPLGEEITTDTYRDEDFDI